MELIEKIFYQELMRVWVLLKENMWFIVLTGIGFAFRVELLNHKRRNYKASSKAILWDIGFVWGITILWPQINENGWDDNVIALLLGLILVYLGYIYINNRESDPGKSESILLLINSFFVTMLSFQKLEGTIVGTVFTITLAYFAYKYWLVKESKADFIEIIFLCMEAIILSIYDKRHDLQGISVGFFVFFQETALFTFNYLFKELILKIFGERESY